MYAFSRIHARWAMPPDAQRDNRGSSPGAPSGWCLCTSSASWWDSVQCRMAFSWILQGLPKVTWPRKPSPLHSEVKWVLVTKNKLRGYSCNKTIEKKQCECFTFIYHLKRKSLKCLLTQNFYRSHTTSSLSPSLVVVDMGGGAETLFKFILFVFCLYICISDRKAGASWRAVGQGTS